MMIGSPYLLPETTGLAVQPTNTIATCPSGRPVLDALTSAHSAVQWMPPAGESVTTDGTVAYIQYRPGLIMAGVPIGPKRTSWSTSKNVVDL